MLTRWLAPVVLLLLPPGEALAQSSADVAPVTDAMLQEPDPSDWLMWRRTLDSWGYSPLDAASGRGCIPKGGPAAWMVPSFDPGLNLIYVGTSVTSPSPKYLLGGADKQHLYHNSTLALDVDTGEIRWYYQHLIDHWDLDHPFERLLVDTAVSPSASAVQWINPRLRPGRSPRTRRSSSAQRGRR